ncbi:MAG: hypothetical protein WCV73_04555 [Patescibacteria group bacterium]|jgi:hypothetical protein
MNRLFTFVAILIAVFATVNPSLAAGFGNYVVTDSKGEIIGKGRDWPNTTVNLPAGSTFTYTGAMGDRGGNKSDSCSVLLALPDGDWENISVTVDKWACRLQQKWSYGQAIEPWPGANAVYPLDRLIDLGGIDELLHRNGFGGSMMYRILADNPTAQWSCLNPGFQNWDHKIDHIVKVTAKKNTRIQIPGIGARFWLGY